MHDSLTVIEAVIPIFGIIGVGLLIRKLNWLTEEADQSMLRVNINLLMPCLIFDAALGNPALSRLGNLLLAPLVGFGTVAVGMLLARLSAKLNGLKQEKEQRTFGVTVGIYNYSYLPIPLTLMLFGSETVGVLFVHNVGVEFSLWTLGVALFTGMGAGRDWRKFINAPLIAILLALLLNSSGLATHLPKPLLAGIHWLGQCSIPMALLVIGAVVADYLREFQASWGFRVILAAGALRLGLLPVLFLLLAKFLPASMELKRVIVIQAAMPSAVFPIVMSRHYGGDPPTAVRVVIGTSLLGLVTIPLWIRFGLKWVLGN